MTSTRSSEKRLSTIGLTAVAVLGLAVLGPVLPAVAADDGLEFSRDGVTWSAEPPGALFDGNPVLVPGTGWTSSVHIRNGYEGAARISAFITNIELSSPVATDTFVVSASDDAGGRFAETEIGAIGDCTSLIPQRVLPAGGEIEFAMTVQIPASVSGTYGQGETMSFDVAVGLVDPIVPEATTCPSGAVIVPAIPSTPTTGGGTPPAASTGGSFGTVPVADGVDAFEPVAPVTEERTPIDDAAEWISCDVRAFAAGVGMPVAICPDVFVNDGAATALMLLFVLVAIMWFLILWRRRHRDDEEDELDHALVAGGAV